MNMECTRELAGDPGRMSGGDGALLGDSDPLSAGSQSGATRLQPTQRAQGGEMGAWVGLTEKGMISRAVNAWPCLLITSVCVCVCLQSQQDIRVIQSVCIITEPHPKNVCVLV